MDDVDRLFECFKCGISPPRKLPLFLPPPPCLATENSKSKTKKIKSFTRLTMSFIWEVKLGFRIGSMRFNFLFIACGMHFVEVSIKALFLIH